MNKRKRRGFTLVEIVLVITILGIISSLGFSKFGDIQESTKEKADYIAAANLASATNLAIQEGKAMVNETDSSIIDKLLEGNYLSIKPKPQSDPSAEFEVSIDGEGNVSVKISSHTNSIYPK